MALLDLLHETDAVSIDGVFTCDCFFTEDFDGVESYHVEYQTTCEWIFSTKQLNEAKRNGDGSWSVDGHRLKLFRFDEL